MDYRRRFEVAPGARLRLADADPAFVDPDQEGDKGAAEIARLLARMEDLQYMLFADGRRSLLIVLQAPDAAGKDGVIRHVVRGMNPQGTTVHAFKVPTPEEAAHDFLWRAHLRAPARGEVAIFNRSHYENVLIVRVHGLVAKSEWSTYYDRINAFETLLAENGTKILKFYLHIDRDEQLERFRRRLEDPMRRWKISEADYAERQFWDDYVEAYEDVFARTSTEEAPWYVIPANRKWFRNLAIARIVTETLEEMDLACPPVHVDLEDIRRRYHAADHEKRGNHASPATAGSGRGR